LFVSHQTILSNEGLSEIAKEEQNKIHVKHYARGNYRPSKAGGTECWGWLNAADTLWLGQVEIRDGGHLFIHQWQPPRRTFRWRAAAFRGL
jgi:hypothetical protein